MGVLAAALGHELNQPLAAILNNAEAVETMLGNERPDLEEIRAAIVDIVQDAVRAGENIRRLGSMFRRQEIRRDVLDPGEVIAEVDHLVRVEALIRNVSFRLETASAVPKIAGDRIQLQQAVLNLVLNAFDAVAASEGEPREVVLRVVSTDDGSVEISVCDFGSGIQRPAAKVRRVNCRICVVPNPSRGVTFQVLLPAVREDRGEVNDRYSRRR
jgi:two-component system sensor kinase FixL